MVVVVPCEVVRNGWRLGQCEGPTITTRHALSADGRNDRHFPRTTMVMGYHPKTVRPSRSAIEAARNGKRNYGQPHVRKEPVDYSKIKSAKFGELIQ